jgi:MoxR-like ATPase
MYNIENIFPFIDRADFVRNINEEVDIANIIGYSEISHEYKEEFDVPSIVQTRSFNAYRVLPANMIYLNEREEVVRDILSGKFGAVITLNIMEYDYSSVANNIEDAIVNEEHKALYRYNDAYLVEDLQNSDIISLCANGVQADKEAIEAVKLFEPETTNENKIPFMQWLNQRGKHKMFESAEETLNLLRNRRKSGKKNSVQDVKGKDAVYTWLDAYFSLPEGEEMKSGGREVVPLLIGPTAVFKSATVKELCKKYNYRLIDLRVAFTSRLDYTGLFEIGEVDSKKYSYSCPMEELVVCSDGFREFCRNAYNEIDKILMQGYTEKDVVSDGSEVVTEKTDLTEEQIKKLEELQLKYKDYMRVPVLFVDEVTRNRSKGVSGLLVQMLNQKRLNDMTLNGCKFVAATNLNISKDAKHLEYQFELDDLYDVNQDLDIAFSNRFIPLKVYPEDVMDRWFEWASADKSKDKEGVSNIHPVVLSFLKKNKDFVYNDSPVLDAIAERKSDNEIKTQVFPNYRTWDMVSNYLYQVDEEAVSDGSEKDTNVLKLYKRKLVEGYISSWAFKPFSAHLKDNGYKEYEEVKEPVADDIGDFVETALSSNSPALIAGASSLGKTARIKQYMKKVKKRTGLEPVLISVNLASKDAVDLMGMPVKQKLTDYVGGNTLDGTGLESVSKKLENIVKEVSSDIKFGMTDRLTLRAPDKSIKDRFKRALEEGREVILFFDEVNRVTSSTVTSAVFECCSDQRFAGVDFSDYKDKVKVVAACNMAWEGMNEEAGGYGDTGTLDPAFAARFSIYWKKQYDKNDVKSFINFMEDEKEAGRIDGTVLEFFKSLSEKDAIQIMASVENRTLEEATPSTRNLYQLSKDIKSMRGKKTGAGFKEKVFNGRVLFTQDVHKKYETLILDLDSDDSIESKINKVIAFVDSILFYKDSWESYLIDDVVKVGNSKISARDIISSLEECRKSLADMILRPMDEAKREETQETIDLVNDLASFVLSLDSKTEARRSDIFKMYIGDTVLTDFSRFFNDTFGTEEDAVITIQDLKDINLIDPFFKKEQAKFATFGGNTEKMVDYSLELCNELVNEFGVSLSPKHYAMFLSGIRGILPRGDNMVMFLRRAGSSLESMFVRAEEYSDDWIIEIVSDYGTRVTKNVINDIRAMISGADNTPKKNKNSKSIIL